MKKSTAKKIIGIGGSIIMIVILCCVITAMPTAEEKEQRIIDEKVLADDSYAVIEGDSMSPTLENDDVIEIHKGTYPEYHDIIVFNHDEDKYIKRVIGLPGDTIEIKDGNVYRNGIMEEFLSDEETNPYAVDEPIVVEEGHYFVLGDNRSSSYDSRMFGSVAQEDVIGTAEKSEDF